MQTIGMLGGMSWESTAIYYRLLNAGIKQSLGGLHSAEICLRSVDFEPLERLQHNDDWDGIAALLTDHAAALAAAGADFLMICTNTMHRVAAEIEAGIPIPLLHIADATGQRLRQDGVGRVGLLGTRFTMEQEFYRARLEQKFDIEVLIPEDEDRDEVHRTIYEELCLGQFTDAARSRFATIIGNLNTAGADAVILGCTEIPMLIQQQHTPTPIYDTTALHCEAAVKMALGRL